MGGASITAESGATATSDSADHTALWTRVEELIGLAPTVQSLRAHRLQLMAARVWRSRGWTVPPELEAEERQAGMIAMPAHPLLSRARAAYGGKLMLMKGAEVAAHYRHPSDRFFCDLDLLADDAAAAQRALIEAGFVQCGDPATYEREQHLCPLVWSGIPLFIEVHRRPNSPAWLPAPPVDEILALSVPSATGVPRLLAPDPAVHALLLVAHSWAQAPLRRLADLIDVEALLDEDGQQRADDLARRWGWEGMWRVAARAGNAILRDGEWPASLSVWARHLTQARDRTVLEEHLTRIAAPASALPVPRVPAAVATAVKLTTRPREDERWSRKLKRSGLALAHAFMPRTRHDQALSERRLS